MANLKAVNMDLYAIASIFYGRRPPQALSSSCPSLFPKIRPHDRPGNPGGCPEGYEDIPESDRGHPGKPGGKPRAIGCRPEEREREEAGPEERRDKPCLKTIPRLIPGKEPRDESSGKRSGHDERADEEEEEG